MVICEDQINLVTQIIFLLPGVEVVIDIDVKVVSTGTCRYYRTLVVIIEECCDTLSRASWLAVGHTSMTMPVLKTTVNA